MGASVGVAVVATDVSVKKVVASAPLTRQDGVAPHVGSDAKSMTFVGVGLLSPLRIGGVAVAGETAAPLSASAALGATSALSRAACGVSSRLSEVTKVKRLRAKVRRNPRANAVRVGVK